MKIGILTSSRADFGIYLPLLKQLKEDTFWDVTIIAFGTHGSPYHGETISEITKAGFENIDLVQSLLLNDNPNGISTSYGLTVMKFADYWSNNNYEAVFCLGDRFEMSAAVQAGIPFGIDFIHLYGGETTLGAIDNIYRHQITLASKFHFTSTEQYRKRVSAIMGFDKHNYYVGSLSLDGIENFQFMDEDTFRLQFGIPNKPYILITVHPETVNAHMNQQYAVELRSALHKLSSEYFLIITMPNADTYGKVLRNVFGKLKSELPEKLLCIENFGKSNYFNAMKYSSFLLGNTSSGIVEAASFGKYVVNIGKRQGGRVKGENIIDCEFEADQILLAVSKIKSLGSYEGLNIYRKPDTAKTIIAILKNYYASL